MGCTERPSTIANLTKKSSYAWLKDGRFRSETEALQLAAQDGSLLLNQYSTEVTTTSGNPKCTVCGSVNKTISHVLSACEEYKW